MVPMDPSLALFDYHFRYVCARACPALLLVLARRLKVYYRQAMLSAGPRLLLLEDGGVVRFDRGA